MHELRAALIGSSALEARQLVDDLLARGTLVHEVLAAFYCAAAQQAIGATGAHDDSAVVLVYGLERNVHELERIGRLAPAAQAVAGALCAMPKIENGATPAQDQEAPRIPHAEELAALVRDQKPTALAALLRALETKEHEQTVREALLDWALDHVGALGSSVVFVNAFLHGFERGGRTERAAMAAHAARHLIGHAAARTALDATWTRKPPMPGAPVAGALLATLRDFHVAGALASLHALCAAGRHDEAMTVLVARAEENAGPRWEHLLFADAVRELLPRIASARRHEALVHVAQRLLTRARALPLAEGLAAGVVERAPAARERERQTARLDDALRRADGDVVREAADVLLFDEEGADRLRRVVVDAACRGAHDRNDMQAFAAVATCLAIAHEIGWPAARATLVRAALAVAESGTQH